jgi:hypothetical protein
MGFYHPATLVKDAQHHGTEVLPIDVTRSGRLCCVERLRGPWPKHLPRPAAAAAARDMGPLYDTLEDDVASPLPEMSRFEETVSDYQTTEMTAGPHLIATSGHS